MYINTNKYMVMYIKMYMDNTCSSSCTLITHAHKLEQAHKHVQVNVHVNVHIRVMIMYMFLYLFVYMFVYIFKGMFM
jgi:hypothetical protein